MPPGRCALATHCGFVRGYQWVSTLSFLTLRLLYYGPLLGSSRALIFFKLAALFRILAHSFKPCLKFFPVFQNGFCIFVQYSPFDVIVIKIVTQVFISFFCDRCRFTLYICAVRTTGIPCFYCIFFGEMPVSAVCPAARIIPGSITHNCELLFYDDAIKFMGNSLYFQFIRPAAKRTGFQFLCHIKFWLETHGFNRGRKTALLTQTSFRLILFFCALWISVSYKIRLLISLCRQATVYQNFP